MSSIVDLKTLRDASGSAFTLARLIRNSLRAIYEEAMVLYLKHSHNNLTADIYRGDPVYGCDMSLAPAVRAQKAAKAARAGPGNRPPPTRPGAPPGRGNRFSRLNNPSRHNNNTFASTQNAVLFNNPPRPQLVPAPGDKQLGPCFSCGAYGHLQKNCSNVTVKRG
jgi:hypothetical protein